MKRTFLTGAVAALALLAAACGSDSDADESSATTAVPATTAAPSTDFVDDLNAICVEGKATGDADEAAFEDVIFGLQAVSENGFVPGDVDYERALAEAVFMVETAIGHREDLGAELAALDAPADAEVALEDFVALNEEAIATLDDLRAGFAADDGAAVRAFFDEAEATNASSDAQRQALADELGAAECAPDED